MRLVYDQNLIPKGILVGQECDAAFDVHLPTGSSLPKKETGLNGWSVKNICCMNRSNWMIHCFAIHPWILLLYFPFSSLPTKPPGLNRHFMEGSEPITFAGHQCRETKVTASGPAFSKQQAPRPRLMIRSFSETCLRPETRPGLSGWTSHGECGYVSKLAQIAIWM